MPFSPALEDLYVPSPAKIEAAVARGSGEGPLMAEIQPIVMPKWGLAMQEGMLAAWHVAEGQEVTKGQEIADIETSKIANAFESPVAGPAAAAAGRRGRDGAGGGTAGGGRRRLGRRTTRSTPSSPTSRRASRPRRPSRPRTPGPSPSSSRPAAAGCATSRWARREGTPVLFIHGFGGDLNNWLFNQPALAETHATYALDLPGHGGSAKEVGAGDVGAMTAAVCDFMAAMGIAKAHLVGHSLGGAISLDLALNHPELVASVTAVAPAALGPEISMEYIDGFITTSRARKLKSVLEMLVCNPDLVTNEMVEDVLKYKRLDGVDAALNTVASACFAGGRQSLQLTSRLGEIQGAGAGGLGPRGPHPAGEPQRGPARRGQGDGARRCRSPRAHGEGGRGQRPDRAVRSPSCARPAELYVMRRRGRRGVHRAAGRDCMIDFKSVLGTLLEFGPRTVGVTAYRPCRQPAGRRPRLDPGQPGRRSGRWCRGGGDLGALLGGLLGNAKQAVGDTKAQVQAGNPMAVGGIGALAGALLGGLRGSPAKGAVGGAALAVLGQIAMSALQKGMGGTTAGQSGLAEAAPTSAPVGGGYQEAAMETVEDDASAELLLRAMINAAKADGQIDGNEMNNILSKLDEAGADQEAKDFVLAEMRRPLDLDSLVAGARTPGLAAAVYAASTMAIKVDTPGRAELPRPAGEPPGHPARRSAPASTPAWASGAPSNTTAGLHCGYVAAGGGDASVTRRARPRCRAGAGRDAGAAGAAPGRRAAGARP